MPPLKVAFVVQGEGRGHMTQALALAAFLQDAGHRITRVLVGRSPDRELPAYVRAELPAPVREFDAPAQIPGRARKGLSPTRTALDVVRRAPAFSRSVRTIIDATSDADVVVNFLDLLGGLATRSSPAGPPTVAVAHNHVFLHPELAGAPGPTHLRRLVLAYARATASGADTVLALSFDPLPAVAGSGVRVVPPLLRPGLERLPAIDRGFLLTYALNPGYRAEAEAWHARHPGVEVHCYVQGGAASHPEPARGFHVHDLDGTGFLRHLATCRAYVGSAGFESICEALWLGRPTLAVPTRGHFEQVLNAWDAGRVGAARPGSYGDLDDFWARPPAPDGEVVARFRRWVARAPQLVVEAVEETARRRRRPGRSVSDRTDVETLHPPGA